MVSHAHSSSAVAANLWQSGAVEVSGGQLAYHRTGGSGPVMLLLHGLTDNGLCWSRVARALETGYDIVMLDARGHGESSRMRSYEVYDPARDIADVIDNLELKSPILMGHSVGAMAAMAFADAYPKVASKIILEDPPFLPPLKKSETIDRQNQFRNQIKSFRTMTTSEITDLGRKLSPDWHAVEFPAWTLGKQQVDPEAWPILLPLWQDIIDKFSAPALLVYGEVERGGLVTREAAADAIRINPNFRAVQIAGAGHNIRREKFCEFMSVISNFLNDDGAREDEYL